MECGVIQQIELINTTDHLGAYLLRKLFYGLLVLMGVVTVVFWMFQGFGDPARLVMGQTGDSATIANIKKELYLDQPKWKQFLLYVNDVSPIAVHSKEEIEKKQLQGLFIGGERNLAIKLPYLRRSYQTKKQVGELLMEALPGTIMLAVAAMLLATILGVFLGVVAAVKKDTWMDTSAVFTSIIGISAPSFFMGILFILKNQFWLAPRHRCLQKFVLSFNHFPCFLQRLLPFEHHQPVRVLDLPVRRRADLGAVRRDRLAWPEHVSGKRQSAEENQFPEDLPAGDRPDQRRDQFRHHHQPAQRRAPWR